MTPSDAFIDDLRRAWAKADTDAFLTALPVRHALNGGLEPSHEAVRVMARAATLAIELRSLLDAAYRFQDGARRCT